MRSYGFDLSELFAKRRNSSFLQPFIVDRNESAATSGLLLRNQSVGKMLWEMLARLRLVKVAITSSLIACCKQNILDPKWHETIFIFNGELSVTSRSHRFAMIHLFYSVTSWKVVNDIS